MKRTLMVFSGLIVFVVIAFFVYDLTKRKLSPCDTIFEQTSAKLSTKLNLVEADGEVVIGNERIQELSEAAQVTALNLKTCCIVLNAGEFDSGQFLECKNSAAKYEAQVDSVLARLQEVEAAEKAGETEVVEEKLKQIDATVDEARSISNALKSRVEKIPVRENRDAENMETGSSGSEKEPNNDLLQFGSIPVDATIDGEIADPADNDYYRFTTPPVYRDIIQIALKNRSTTLKPAFRIFNSEKTDISDWHWKGTAGADQSYSFSSPPDTVYYIQIKSSHDNTSGAYALTVKPLRAYDEYEPNDDTFNATDITPGKPVDASIMDGPDNDFYRIKTPPREGKLAVSVKNRSTTLMPALRILNSEKTDISDWHWKGTPGADLTYSLPAQADAVYYLQFKSSHNNTSGAYTLAADMEEPD